MHDINVSVQHGGPYLSICPSMRTFSHHPQHHSMVVVASWLHYHHQSFMPDWSQEMDTDVRYSDCEQLYYINAPMSVIYI